ncbi:hypothetical protein IF1G_10838 [Cordyceps javanica]|uniref:Uncharacterized protein n=1 Tax=Cordyceps javanica TaxID=43265 RepID=A0A545UM20_9HYPO|nr:hypothetical protein IF1G_10838 [Cordyceps javanica]
MIRITRSIVRVALYKALRGRDLTSGNVWWELAMMDATCIVLHHDVRHLNDPGRDPGESCRILNTQLCPGFFAQARAWRPCGI